MSDDSPRNTSWLAFAASIPPKAHRSHDPGDGAAGDIEALLLQQPPDLAHAVDIGVRFEDAAYLDLQGNVAAGADRQPVHVQAFGNVLVIG